MVEKQEMNHPIELGVIPRETPAGKEFLTRGIIFVADSRPASPKPDIMYGHRLHLTPNESKVLELLMRSSNYIKVPEMVRQLWPEEPETDKPTPQIRRLRVLIHNLKGKIGTERIKSKRGAGYFFNACDETVRMPALVQRIGSSICLYPNSLQTAVGNKVIELSETEYHLWEVLALRINQFVSFKDLIAFVWAFEIDWTDKSVKNSLRVYIRFLRKKLAKLSDQSVRIVNKRSYGYMLAENPHTTS